MESEPGGQLTAEHNLTEKTIREVSRGRIYNINIATLDEQSIVELRRLIRDLDDRNAQLKRIKAPVK